MSNQELLNKFRDTIVIQDIKGCTEAAKNAVDAARIEKKYELNISEL